MNDSFGNRMKDNYENVAKFRLTRRTPVIIRIDGKTFHTFTRKFDRPFDKILRSAMAETMHYLCKNIQGCVFGYCQSDEISLCLIDYKKLTSDAYFDYEVQKMASVTASMATMKFNHVFTKLAREETQPDSPHNRVAGTAMFDARCFSIPREEVANYFYWRQLDATRNSINMVGFANFSAKEMHGKNTDQVQDMLFIQKGINWNDFSPAEKRGVACYKETVEANFTRSVWVVDCNMPILRGEDRNYVEKWLNPDKEDENEKN